ncbi:hypothetical protein BHE74_00000682 [Ensete ventricosum]|nr:hypothetical protein GW17_00001923 [Ensete ventricosum]RWW90171.1 hypothetical protein BHE74_00000682 [Ensete ventricosum]RZR77111.1 hypothetical protein BHM03_00002100 [Ensete ventricosum]
MEEVRAEVCSSLESISQAPFVKIEHLQCTNRKEHVYSIVVAPPSHTASASGNAIYSPHKGDILVLSDFKPSDVSDLTKDGQPYRLVSVCKDEFDDLSPNNYVIRASEEIDVATYNSSNKKQRRNLFAFYLVNSITYNRIWKAINVGLADKRNLSLVLEALQVDTKKSINLIWGPPGTGKTKTISGLVWLLDLLSCRTLICAPTNTAVKEVALRLLKLVKQFSGNSRCRLGDVVLCGNEQRMRINDGLQDVFLDFRVKRIQESFAQKTGWKHCLSSMLEFFEDGVSLYRKFLHGRKVSEGDKDISEEKEVGYDDKMFSVDKLGNDVEDFLSFARRKFRVLSKQICSCFEMLYLHIPRAALSESNCKVILILFDLLKEFDKLLFKVDAGSKLEEIFRSRAEKVEDSSSEEMLDFGAATSFMVRRTRASCCETLRALERSLKRLPSISSKGPMYGPYSFINIGHGRESLDSLGRSRKNEVEIVVILQILRNLHKDYLYADRPLPGGSVRNRSSTVDFGYRQPIEEEIVRRLTGGIYRSTRLSVRGPPATGRFRQKSIVGGRLKGEIDRRRSIEGEIDRRWSIEREKGKKKKKKKKKNKKRKEEKKNTYRRRAVLAHASLLPAGRLRAVTARKLQALFLLHGEKDQGDVAPLFLFF